MIWLDLSENGLCHEAAVELARWLNDPTTKLRWHFQCALNTNLFEDEDVLLIANAFYGCVHVRKLTLINIIKAIRFFWLFFAYIN